MIAFEPVESFLECLVKNVNSDRLKIEHVALGDIETSANMNITLENMGHTHIDPGSIGNGTTLVRTLDSFEFHNVDYIKMDCEGFEYKVILGAKQTICESRPIVVVEQKPHDTYKDDYGQFAAVELLQSWGMRCLEKVKDDWIMGW